jgi:hypothetical protein
MVQFIYNPTIIKEFISIAYCTYDELIQNENNDLQKCFDLIYYPFPYESVTTYAPGQQLNNLFYLIFDPGLDQWLFYHKNTMWHYSRTVKMIINMRTIERYLDNFSKSNPFVKENKYIGVIKNNKEIQFINIINEKDENVLLQYNIYPTDTINFFCKLCMCWNYNLKKYTQTIFDKCQDIIIPSKKGLVHINPQSDIDMIFSIMRKSKNKNHNKELALILSSKEYHCNLDKVFDSLNVRFTCIQTIYPKPEYSKIFQLINQNDEQFYNKKMPQFQTGVIKIFESQKVIKTGTHEEIGIFIGNFISSFETDLALELTLVYHRLRFFPWEKNKLFKTFPNHPYVKLLLMIQNYYDANKKHLGKYISANDISMMLKKDDFVTSDETTKTIIEATISRSELFTYMYELYLETKNNNIEPKYTIKYNYFPFKIFSGILFAMDHMFSID